MARVLVAMANKSSEDTARRVARARLQEAQDGKTRSFRITRRFGYSPDGEIVAAEAEVIRQGAKRILAGQSWASLVKFFTDSGVRPPKAREWNYTSIRQIYMTPSIAGIATYNGVMRADSPDYARSRFADPEATALKDASGNYIMGSWQAILDAEEWKALAADAAELADVQRRLFSLRTGYARGTVSDDSMFNVVPELEARERKLKSELARKAKARISRQARDKSPADVRREWDQAADVGVRRAILSRYLKAVIVRKTSLRGPGVVDYSAIEPVWREDGDILPEEYLI